MKYLTQIGNFLVTNTARSGLLLAKKSPEIFITVGVIGVVGTVVLACKATRKVDEILNKHKEEIQKINDIVALIKEGEIESSEYSDKDRIKDLVVTYTKTGTELIKLYAPTITVGAISIACLIGSHGIMKGRNLALMAAYKTLEEGFNKYRKRIIEEHGEEKDYMYKNGLRAETFIENEINAEGKTQKVKKTKLVSDPNGLSCYAKFFDESSTQWTKTPEYNLMFLRSQQNYYNNMLTARGHVFLNEIYDALGIPRTGSGAVVGWVLGKGDNYIDFGIYDGDREKQREFVNGYEKSILLDFNVDGVIYDII